MPKSSKEGKDIIRNWLLDFNDTVSKVVDLGPGRGTYHKYYARKARILTHAYWIGIEVWKPYLEEFGLNDIYDEVYVEDVRFFDFSKIGDVDLVFAGDILEHMTKEESVQVVLKVLKYSKKLIISIPIIYHPQHSDVNPYEIHVKDDWSHEEVLDTFPHIKKHHKGEAIGVYLLEK
jgi:SAM-dependent methyltransferase